MRYYSIEITKADGTPYLFQSLNGQALSSLLPQGSQNPIYGQTNPGALNIEFDIGVANQTDPDNNGAYLRIWGLGLQDIGSAANLNDCSISISAGMAKGLPLANPQQAGVIMTGVINQAYGNWAGTEQTVDLIFVAGGNSGSGADAYNAKGNFPFDWQPGTSMSSAIAQTLSIALPGVAQQIGISPDLTVNYAITGHYQTLQQFADFVNGLSQSLIGGNYNGVVIALTGNTVNVFDGTAAVSSTKAIAFTDLIGQSTWIGPQLISVKTVLRADLQMGDVVSLPSSLVTQTAQSYLRFQDKSTFSGNYQIIQVHHYGSFRQASADAWNTTFQMTPATAN